jgi:ubiquinone/menaquinone biosynthesis C-methylase UbiE
MARETARFNDEVLDALAPGAGERILEIGYGHGRTLLAAARRTADAHLAGIDVAPTAARAAARRCRALVEAGRLDLRTGDGAELPWDDATFDAAFSVHTLYFWSDPARPLAELHRVLRPGGRFVLGFRERSDDAVARFPPPTYRFYAPDEVTALLTRAGFAAATVRAASTAPELRIATAVR